MPGLTVRPFVGEYRGYPPEFAWGVLEKDRDVVNSLLSVLVLYPPTAQPLIDRIVAAQDPFTIGVCHALTAAPFEAPARATPAKPAASRAARKRRAAPRVDDRDISSARED